MANTYYHPDKAIERWAYMRENTHQTFRWNRRNIAYGLLWGIAVPLGIYVASVAEFHAFSRSFLVNGVFFACLQRTKEQSLNRPEQKMLGK